MATELLRWQLGWDDGIDLLAADSIDPERFAHHVVTLNPDADLWRRLRENALQRLRAENNREHYSAVIQAVLGDRSIERLHADGK